MLIPILKLTASNMVMSTEFQLTVAMQVICWILTWIVIGFNVFLFITHITSTLSFVFMGTFGILYLVCNSADGNSYSFLKLLSFLQMFLIWLIWLPLEYQPHGDDGNGGWMAISTTEDDDDEDIERLSAEAYALQSDGDGAAANHRRCD